MAKVSVITGGAGGIGIETVKLLAKEASVLVVDFQEERIAIAKEELKYLDNVEYICADVSKIEDAEKVGAKAREMGEVLHVIHAAAINEAFIDYRPSATEIVTNNVGGAINMGRVFFPLVGEGSCYLNVASMSSYYADYTLLVDRYKAALNGDFQPLIDACGGEINGTEAYSVSKRFTRWYTMANIDRMSEKGARIVSISPGLIWTPMPQAVEKLMPGVITGFACTCPVEGRMGKPEEAAELIDFMLHAKYINGEDVLIYGGMLNHCNIEQLDD